MILDPILCYWFIEHVSFNLSLKVEVYHSKSRKSNEHVIDLKSGDIFGELAILYNCRRTASVRADTEVILWELNRKDFQVATSYFLL